MSIHQKQWNQEKDQHLQKINEDNEIDVQKLIYNFDSKTHKNEQMNINYDGGSQPLLASQDQIPVHTTQNGMTSSSSNFASNNSNLRSQQNRGAAINYQQSSPTYSNQNQLDANGNGLTFEQQLQQKKAKRKRNYIIGGVIIAALIIILIIVLATTLRKSSSPFIYDPIPNPYNLIQSNYSQYGAQKFMLQVDRSRNNFQVRVRESENNYLFENVEIEAQMLQYNQMRLRIGNSDQANVEPQNLSSYQKINDQFFNQDYLKQSQQGLNNNQLGFEVVQQTQNDISNDQSHVYWRLYDKSKQGLEDIVSSQNQELTLMSRFTLQGLKLNSSQLIGLGENFDGNIFLKSGNYTLDPQANLDALPIQQDVQVKTSFYPFLIAILKDQKYLGIYVRSNYALQFEVIINQTSQTSVINIMSTAGQIDLQFFYDSNYNHLLSKFHNIIGKPSLLPYWSQGLFIRGKLLDDPSQALNLIDNYKSKGIPIQGISFTLGSLVNGTNFGFQDSITQIRRKYPQLQFIVPFTYFVQKDQGQIIQEAFVQFNNQNLEVQMNFGSQQSGYCMDPFNPNITSYLQKVLKNSQYDPQYYGLWLDQNQPYIDSIQTQSTSNSDIFQDLPFQPRGTEQIQKKTLPYSSQFQLQENSQNLSQIYSFDLQTSYGSQFALKVIESLQQLQSKQPFIIADSTQIGMGQYGVGLKQYKIQLSYQDLKRQVLNMIQYGTYGNPNIMTTQCSSQEVDLQLCLAYYKLSILSPLLIIQDVDTQEQDLISSLTQTQAENFKKISNQRMRFLTYQRGELQKLKQYGGSLIRPLFADYTYDSETQDFSDVSTVLFGQSIVVNLPLEQNSTNSTFYFPDYKLIDLNTMEVLRTYIGQGIQVNVTYEDDKLNMYQKGVSSIIAFQNTTKYQVSKVEDLKNIPIIISVSMDGFLQGGYAQGQIYLEQGQEQDFKTEFYEVKALDYIISIKQQNSGAAEQIGATSIEKIYISFLDKQINQACAIMNDLSTVQQLYVASYNFTRQQAVIQPNDPNNPKDTSTLKINQVAFILYGQSNQKCDRSMLDLQLDQILDDTDFTMQFKVTQKIAALYGGWTYPLYFNITLLTDNSIYFRIDSLQNPGSDRLQPIYDRQFTQFYNKPSLKLKDILTYNQDPFYIEIRNPSNKNQILFTTKDQLIFSHIDFNIFNFEQPSSNGERFYGLGERKGDFYLKDKYTYALFSNNNNVPSSYQALGRVIEYGKNGHFPIFYSQLSGSSNVNSLVIYTPQGTEFTFSQQKDRQSPRMSLLQHNAKTEFTLIFNKPPLVASQQVQQHIKLGKMYDGYKSMINGKFLPPLEFMYGTYQIFKDQDLTMKEYVQQFKNSTQQPPLEGLMLSMDSLDGFQSMSFNETNYSSIRDDLYFMQQNGLKIFQIQKSGVSIENLNDYLKFIFSNNLTISGVAGTDQQNLTGIDEQGSVIYVDYSVSTSQQYIDLVVNDFMKNYSFDETQFGIQLKRNEISNLYCSEGGICFKEQFDQDNINWVGKPGNTQMTLNSFGYAFRSIGREDEFHNLNGLMESIQYANNFGSEVMPILSDSTSMGMGQMGFLGRVQEFYEFSQKDITQAIQGLQTLNTLGMPLIGQKFDVNSQNLQNPLIQTLLSQTMILNALSPLSMQNIDLGQDFSSLPFNAIAILRLKYSLLKHQRTHHYLFLNDYTPVIRPLFLDYPQDQETYKVIDKQFMNGDSVLIMIQDLTKSSQQMYFPKGLWCRVSYLSLQTACIQSFGEYKQVTNDSLALYLSQGSITILQNTIATNISNTQDLINNYPIDLHILIDPTTQLAQGRLLVHGYDPNYQGFCDLQLNFKNDQLTITDLLLLNPNQQSLGGGSPNQLQCNYRGYYLGKIYIYNAQANNYNKAVVNDKYQMKLVLTTKDDPNLIGFQAPMSNMHIADIQNIKFTK
eukprot:403352970